MNFTGLLGDYEDAYSTLKQDTDHLLTQNLQDRRVRSGLSLAGRKSTKDAASQAVEWWEFDWEYAKPPVELHLLRFPSPVLTLMQEQSSQEFAIANYVRTSLSVFPALDVMKLMGLRTPIFTSTRTRTTSYMTNVVERIRQGRTVYFPIGQRSTTPSEHPL